MASAGAGSGAPAGFVGVSAVELGGFGVAAATGGSAVEIGGSGVAGVTGGSAVELGGFGVAAATGGSAVELGGFVPADPTAGTAEGVCLVPPGTAGTVEGVGLDPTARVPGTCVVPAVPTAATTRDGPLESLSRASSSFFTKRFRTAMTRLMSDGRSAAFFESSLVTSSSSSGETSCTIDLIEGGAAFRCFSRIESTDAPMKGGRRVMSSKTITPYEYMSARWSCDSFRICSGAM